jgi:thiol-disulfide isomerase/thioredoxin
MTMLLRLGATVLLLSGLAAVSSASAQDTSWQDEHKKIGGVILPVEDNPAWEKYDFELSYADGTDKVSFKDLARSGEPFVLVWWLTECPICHLQMPYVQKLQSMVEKDQVNLKVVSICIDEDNKDCLKYVKEKKISFPVLLDQRARRTDKAFKIRDLGTPSTYVFKGGGILVDSISGFKNSYPDTVLKMLGIASPEKSRSTDSSPQRGYPGRGD